MGGVASREHRGGTMGTSRYEELSHGERARVRVAWRERMGGAALLGGGEAMWPASSCKTGGE